MATQKSFESYILKEVNRIIKETGNEVADELERRLPPTSAYYRRTGDVIRALRNPPKAKIVDGKLIYFIYNSNLIRPRRASSRIMFNHHMSWGGYTSWEGLYLPEWVPVFLDRGFRIMGKKGIVVKQYPALDYINGALNMSVTDYVTDLLSEALTEYIQKLMVRIK